MSEGFVPKPEMIKRIIKGNDIKDIKDLVEQAEKIGGGLANTLKTNQIRAFFGQVKQIELSVNRDSSKPENAPLETSDQRKLNLLKPKLAYQARRIGSVKPLEEIISPAIDFIENRKEFQNFVDFFEAILAYHKAKGGKD
jgi:CRISPR-associated protein Csm2